MDSDAVGIQLRRPRLHQLTMLSNRQRQSFGDTAAATNGSRRRPPRSVFTTTPYRSDRTATRQAHGESMVEWKAVR